MKKVFVPLILFINVFSACSMAGSETSFMNAATGKDFKSPVLESVETINPYTVCMSFSEDILAYEDSFENCSVQTEGSFLYIYLDLSLKAGKSYTIKGRVSDLSGNTCSVSVKAWGFNNNPASLFINEFTTKGTSASPDRTELYVLSGGSLAGMCLYDGIPSDYRTLVMLPDIAVEDSSYVVIWWTESLPSGVAFHPNDKLYNICASSKTNLSENNGIITLVQSPSEGSRVLDCIAYSSFDSKEYEGFGTKEVLVRVENAREQGYLTTDVVSSKGSTATRSIARKNDNSWYITESSGSSFGSANTSAEFSK